MSANQICLHSFSAYSNRGLSIILPDTGALTKCLIWLAWWHLFCIIWVGWGHSWIANVWTQGTYHSFWRSRHQVGAGGFFNSEDMRELRQANGGRKGAPEISKLRNSWRDSAQAALTSKHKDIAPRSLSRAKLKAIFYAPLHWLSTGLHCEKHTTVSAHQQSCGEGRTREPQMPLSAIQRAHGSGRGFLFVLLLRQMLKQTRRGYCLINLT